MKEKETAAQFILRCTQAGTIICRIAKILNITPVEALKGFLSSKTYASFRNPNSILNYYGDPVIADMYIEELRNHPKTTIN